MQAAILPPVFVKDNRKIIRLNPTDIICLSIEKNYTHIYILNEEQKKFDKLIIRTTLANALKKLPEELFVQINRSQVVAIHHIDKIEGDELNIGRNFFTIQKQFRKSVLEKLNIID